MNKKSIKLFAGQTGKERPPTPNPLRKPVSFSETSWKRYFPDEWQEIKRLIEPFHEKNLAFPLSKVSTPSDFVARCRTAIPWRQEMGAFRVELGREIGLNHPRIEGCAGFLFEDLAGLRKQLTFVIQPLPVMVKLYSWESLENCLRETFTTINAALFRSDWYHEWINPEAETLSRVVKDNIFESLRVAIAAHVCGLNVDLMPLLRLWSSGFIPLAFNSHGELASLFGYTDAPR